MLSASSSDQLADGCILLELAQVLKMGCAGLGLPLTALEFENYIPASSNLALVLSASGNGALFSSTKAFCCYINTQRKCFLLIFELLISEV